MSFNAYMDRLERDGVDTVEVGTYRTRNGIRPYVAEPGKDVVTGYRDFPGVIEQATELFNMFFSNGDPEKKAADRYRETDDRIHRWTKHLEDRGFTVRHHDRTHYYDWENTS